MLGPGGQDMIAIDRGANAQFSTADREPGHRRDAAPGNRATILNPAPAQDLSAHDLSCVSVITPNETEAHACLGLGAGERADEEAPGRRLLERGFSLNATRIAGPDRRGLERLCGYVARPALAGGRLRLVDADHLSLALQTPWSDGTRPLLLSPMELLEKLAALVPPPRFYLLRFHGVLAPRARARDRIVPDKAGWRAVGGGRRDERCGLRPSTAPGDPAGAGVFLRPQPMRGLRRAPADRRRPDRSDLDTDLSGGGRAAGDAPAESPAA